LQIKLVSIHPYPSPQSIPLANAFLQSYLTTKTTTKPETTRVDFFPGRETQEYVNELITGTPLAIGFSIYVWNRHLCVEIAAGLRKAMPSVRLFAGGPEATADPEGVLNESCFDFLIVGEGEEPFAAFCHCISDNGEIAKIPGIATIVDGQFHLEPDSPITDLDNIPSPWLNHTLDASQHKGILWQLSRGCGFSCDFCFDSRGNAGVRRFSMDRLDAELRHFVKSNVSQIFVLDSTFNQDAQRAKSILRLIKKKAPHIHFHFEVRSEFIDKEMAQLFAQITCSLQIGLQSADPVVLKGIGRVFNRKDFEKRVAMLNEAGAVFGFDLMYGLPGDTLKGFRESLDFALRQYPNHLDIFPLAILPGTALASRVEALGLHHLPAPPYTLISTADFSTADMALAAQLANACDIFYSRGKAVAWFNSVVNALKLTPSDFLGQFAEWLAADSNRILQETDLDDIQVWQMQRRFLQQKFSSKQLNRLLPLVLDLIDYHYHYAAALLTQPPDIPDEAELPNVLEYPARLATSTRMVTFNYEILDILESCEPDLRKLSDMAARTGSWTAIYPAADGIRTESLIEPYYRLLEGLDGKTPGGQVAAKLGIPEDEAVEFLEFAVLEGIIGGRQ